MGSHWRRRVLGFAAAGLIVVGLSGCGQSAKDLWEVGQLEEQQNSPERARQNYEWLLRDYPNSPEAKLAAERLRVLEAAPAAH